MPSLPFGLLDRWLSPAPSPARIDWLAGQSYAHRGLHAPGLPENSPAAFAAAMARGMGIECDIQRSRDGHAMVFHDATLDRLTSMMTYSGVPVATISPPPSPPSAWQCGGCWKAIRGAMPS